MVSCVWRLRVIKVKMREAEDAVFTMLAMMQAKAAALATRRDD
jgi:hypothetical protein